MSEEGQVLEVNEEPKSSATLSMEAQSSVVIGLPFKEGVSMKDAKFYGNTADEIFNQHEQSIRRFLKLREDYAAGNFNPEPEGAK
jgi:hypothetical protein